jgi:signal transduction histidine kinase
MRSVNRLAPLVVTGVALLAALIAGGAAIGMIVREARAGAAAQRPEYVASTKVYDPKGKLVNESTPSVPRPPLFGLASRLMPPEVNCSTTAGGTTCVETTPAPLALRLASALEVLGGAIAASVVLGLLGGMFLARAITAPLRRMADVLGRAAHENAYSVRVEPAGVDARLSASINELLTQMQQRDVELRRRSTELEAVNKDLEAFAYSVSHDLRAPLGSIDGFVQALEMDYSEVFDDTAREYFGWIREGCRQMRDLIDGLLQMTRLTRAEVQREQVDLSSIAASVAESLKQSNPTRSVRFDIRSGVRTVGDERLLRAVLENLMSNAWKFTRNRAEACIEFGQSGGAYYVRDNGAGFDPSHAAKMFRPFQRLHSMREFEGTGIGLATVQKIVERHGGRVWAEGEVEKGATIYFTTGAQEMPA